MLCISCTDCAQGVERALMFSKTGAESGFTSRLTFEPNRHRGVEVFRTGDGNPPPVNLAEKPPMRAAER